MTISDFVIRASFGFLVSGFVIAMSFFSKTIDKLKGALKKTAAVLNTDVRTLFVPGRQIDESFLDAMEEKFIRADMGVFRAEKLKAEVREQWRLGKIKNADEAESIVRNQLLAMLPSDDRELKFVPSGPTVMSRGAFSPRAKIRMSKPAGRRKRRASSASVTSDAIAGNAAAAWKNKMKPRIIRDIAPPMSAAARLL